MSSDFCDRVAGALASRNLALFLGAGVSNPSGLPTAPQIVTAILCALKDSLRSPLTCSSEFGPSFSDKMRIEYLCRTLAEVDARLGLLPLTPLARGEPTSVHYFVAACAKAGDVKYIVTTNFDLLIERALDALGVAYAVLCTEDQYCDVEQSDSRCFLVKLHGSLDASTGQPLPGIVADVRAVGKGLSDARARTLGRIARERSLLFLGYSGRDYFGAMPILFACKPQPVFWVDHVPSETLCSRNVTNWITAGTGGQYVQMTTGDLLRELAVRGGISHESGNPARVDVHYSFVDHMSELEKAFALTWLYSRDLEGNVQVLHKSFEDCEKLPGSADDDNRLLLARLYRRWVSTMERVGRSSLHVHSYIKAVDMLQKAHSIAPSDSPLALDIEVALCDMQFRVAWLSGGSGIQFLPSIEMLIDRCLAINDHEILARAYSTKAGICQHGFGKSNESLAMALEADDRAAEALEVVGAQDMLPVLYFHMFKLALALGESTRAASALMRCLAGTLLTAHSPDDEFVVVLASMAKQMADHQQYRDSREIIFDRLSALGLSSA